MIVLLSLSVSWILQLAVYCTYFYVYFKGGLSLLEDRESFRNCFSVTPFTLSEKFR
jgi:hypothetical protein